MTVEIETEAALFPEKDYINGIFVAVQGVTVQTPNINVTLQDIKNELEALSYKN